MYEEIKEKLDEAGEVMIAMDSGEKHEIHAHNTEFLDDKKLLKVDESEKIHWFSGEKIERYWIHKEF